MNKLLLSTVIGGLILGGFSCKTNEKNYRQAYETAMVKTDSAVDEGTMTKIKAEEDGVKTLINGDSVNVKTEFVQNIDAKPGEATKQYGVVVGDFKQSFNAQSFKKRLIEKGYPAYVLQNRDNKYYVIIKGFDTNVEAASYIKDAKKNIPFAIPVGKPWILASVR